MRRKLRKQSATLPFPSTVPPLTQAEEDGGYDAAAVYESNTSTKRPSGSSSATQQTESPPHPFIRFFVKLFGHALGLLFIATGLLAMATALLTPAHLENQKLNWEGRYLRLQADRIAEQHDAYQSALIALEARDESLLQQLAISYLNLKPAGSEMLEPHRQSDGLPQSQSALMPSLHNKQRDAIDTIEAWLHRPMPVVGKDIKPLDEPDGLLGMASNMTLGIKRILLFAIGGALTMLSLLLPIRN